MSLSNADENSATEIHVPADIDWAMLDKSKFFFLGAALFSGVSFSLYPIVVLKTRQQMLPSRVPCIQMTESILRHDGYRGFYRGFTTSLVGAIPARALYMGALELTRSNVASVASDSLGSSEASAWGQCCHGSTAGLEPGRCRQPEADGPRFPFSLIEKV